MAVSSRWPINMINLWALHGNDLSQLIVVVVYFGIYNSWMTMKHGAVAME